VGGQYEVLGITLVLANLNLIFESVGKKFMGAFIRLCRIGKQKFIDVAYSP